VFGLHELSYGVVGKRHLLTEKLIDVGGNGENLVNLAFVYNSLKPHSHCVRVICAIHYYTMYIYVRSRATCVVAQLRAYTL